MNAIPEARIEETSTQRPIGAFDSVGAVLAGAESDEFTRERFSDS
jgi:hypothetical protein